MFVLLWLPVAILDALDAVEGRFAEVRRPDGGCVIHSRLDVRLIYLEQGFLLAAPSSASQGIHNSKFTSTFLAYLRGVRIKVEMRVKADAEDLWILV